MRLSDEKASGSQPRMASQRESCDARDLHVSVSKGIPLL
jgi:hypothetical protein